MSRSRRCGTRDPLSGALLIADITGYSVYLRDSELVHAQGVLASLLELLVDNTRPPLAVSKLEGDAVFSFGLGTAVPGGQVFLELVESAYVAFRRALEQMVTNTSCECNACANIATLDLKFFIHFGEFVVTHVAGHEELQGSDVNLAHRLLKNSVVSSTGLRAYAFITAAAAAALGLGELTGSMVAHSEQYDDIGVVPGWVHDLAPVWEARRSERAFDLFAAEALLEVVTKIDLPVEVVWSYLLDPRFRSTLIGSDRQEIEGTRNGRVAADTVYVCYHGDRIVTQVVLEVVPFEAMVTRDLTPLPGGATYVLLEYRLERVGHRTRLIQRMARPEGPRWGRAATRMAAPFLARRWKHDIDAFARLVEMDHAATVT